MKKEFKNEKILIFLVLPLLLLAEVYNVPVGSRGNKVVLKIINSTCENINNLIVTPRNNNDCVEVLDNFKIPSFEKNTVQPVEFVFNILENARVDSVYDIHFDILSDNSLKSEKAIQVKITAPEKFELFDNYPNPFNPVTMIKYKLSKRSKVTLSVYNLSGQLVETLVRREQAAGIYTKNWYAANFSSGVYFYRIKVETSNNTDVVSKKMILLK